MLPGLRFLFSAIVLSISLLIFGLGAAALLRAAHQEFASVPYRPAPPERVFAQQGESATPTLAMLRAETDAAEEEALARPAPDSVEAAAEPDIAPSVVAAEPATAESRSIAAPMTAAAEPQISAPITSTEAAVRGEAGPPVQPLAATEILPLIEAPTPAETRIVAAEIVPTPPSTETIPDEREQPNANTLTPADAAIKIATLGGPPVEIEAEASPIKVKKKSRDAVKKKRQRVERAAERRKTVRRASTTQHRAARASAIDPFAQPFGGFPGVSSRNQ